MSPLLPPASWNCRFPDPPRTRPGRVRRSSLRFLITAALLLAIGAGPPTLVAAGRSPERHVLVLLSDQQSTMMTDTTLLAGLRAALNQPHADPITLHLQSLDLAERPSDAHNRALAAWLRERFSARPIDVVVSLGTGASTFAARYADTIWPRVTVAFVAVDDRWVNDTPRPARSVALTIRHDYLATAHAALMLVPGARRLVLVSDTALDRRRADSIHQQLSLLSAPADVLDLTEVPPDDVPRRLQSLAATDVILALTPLPGATAHDRPAVADLAGANRPIFTVDESLIGAGAVGGLVVNYGDLGRRVGVLVERLLDGAAPERMQAMNAIEPAWVFDWRQLRRWKLEAGSLPPGSDVRFREPGVRDLVIGLLALLLLAAAVTYLLIRRGRRRAAAPAAGLHPSIGGAERQRQLHDLAHMNMIAAMGEVAASVAHELNQPLTAVLSNAQAARRLLTANTAGPNELREILDDIIEQDRRAGEIIHRIRGLLTLEQVEWTPVEVHEGRLSAGNRPAGGAEFVVTLPAEGDET